MPAALGCSRNEPKIGQIIWKTASFPFQFQVREEIQHLSHFSLSGAHHTREVQAHPSPHCCQSNSPPSAVWKCRWDPWGGSERAVPGRDSSRLCPRVCCTNFRASPVIYRNISALRGSRAAALCVCVFELIHSSVYTSGFLLFIFTNPV